MIRLPPWSTLFPYTTLFRSHQVAEAALDHLLGRALERPVGRGEGQVLREVLADPLAVRVLTLAQGQEDVALGDEDRKSTRLNSSHANISYAVFCLIKKYETQ